MVSHEMQSDYVTVSLQSPWYAVPAFRQPGESDQRASQTVFLISEIRTCSIFAAYDTNSRVGFRRPMLQRLLYVSHPTPLTLQENAIEEYNFVPDFIYTMSASLRCLVAHANASQG